MNTQQTVSPRKNYRLLTIAFIGAIGLNYFTPFITELISHTGDPSTTTVFAMLSILFGFGYIANRCSEGTILPSFVTIILFGLVLADILAPTTAIVMQVAMVFANLILYLGGIEIPRENFAKIMKQVLLLGILGCILHALLYGWALTLIGIDPTTSYLLGFILASTDPAALMPVFNKLKLKKKAGLIDDELQHVSIAESAVNDVIGSVMTLILLNRVADGVSLSDFSTVLSVLGTKETLFHLGQEILIGLIIGGASYVILHWYQNKKKEEKENNIDIGLLLFVPTVAWTLATMFHGAGFLAAFIAGLIALYGKHDARFEHTSHMLESKLEVYAKPAIFMLLGPLVDFGKLIEYLPQGLLATTIFFALRFVTVFVTLSFTKRYTVNELLFFGCVREAGVIPAVLLIVVGKTIPGMDALFPIGIINIVLSLVILPMITPWWAKKCGVVE
jgi:cell volume regulation protein A